MQITATLFDSGHFEKFQSLILNDVLVHYGVKCLVVRSYIVGCSCDIVEAIELAEDWLDEVGVKGVRLHAVKITTDEDLERYRGLIQ